MTAALHNPHVTVFGAMDKVYGPGTAQALRDSGGPWEYYDLNGWEGLPDTPSWTAFVAYRLKPKPPKPWSGWVELDDAGLAFHAHEDGAHEDGPPWLAAGHRLIRVVEVIE